MTADVADVVDAMREFHKRYGPCPEASAQAGTWFIRRAAYLEGWADRASGEATK